MASIHAFLGRGFAAQLAAAALAAALLVLALPKPDLYPLAWGALAPLLAAIYYAGSKRRAFLLGYGAGVVFFGGTCYWIVSTMSTYGGLSLPISLGVFALFVVVFAGHTGLFAWLLRAQVERFGARGLLLAPPAWVAVELVQSHLLFGGFPWMLAGYALAPFGGLVQLTTWTGIYGLSFLVAAVGAALALAVVIRSWKPAAGGIAAALALSLLPAPAGEPGETFAVRVVQTHIDIEQSWLPEPRQRLLDELRALTLSGAPAPDLVVWPETPAPIYLAHDPETRAWVAGIAAALDAPFLLGYIDFIGEAPSNSAGVIAPDGAQISRYDKMHLVPFGEYVPMKSVLFFAESLVRNVGDFAPGSEFVLTELDGRRLAATICYEDVFPGLMRQFTRRGAEVIVNITNDGWFGSSSAPYQHLRMAQVRAVEARRYLVRAANTGISAIIDPWGRIVARTALGERTVLDGVAGYRSDLTFYVRYGDVFAYAMTALALAFVFIGRFPSSERRGGARSAGVVIQEICRSDDRPATGHWRGET